MAGVPPQPAGIVKENCPAARTFEFAQLPMPYLSFKLPVQMSKRFYITTAIDYVNGEPHLGHAYEKIVADVIARSHRSLGGQVFFLTGVDEHGQKVQQGAQAQGKTPQAYCDELAAVYTA